DEHAVEDAIGNGGRAREVSDDDRDPTRRDPLGRARESDGAVTVEVERDDGIELAFRKDHLAAAVVAAERRQRVRGRKPGAIVTSLLPDALLADRPCRQHEGFAAGRSAEVGRQAPPRRREQKRDHLGGLVLDPEGALGEEPRPNWPPPDRAKRLRREAPRLCRYTLGLEMRGEARSAWMQRVRPERDGRGTIVGEQKLPDLVHLETLEQPGDEPLRMREILGQTRGERPRGDFRGPGSVNRRDHRMIGRVFVRNAWVPRLARCE